MQASIDALGVKGRRLELLGFSFALLGFCSSVVATSGT